MYTWFSVILCLLLVLSLCINGIQSYSIHETLIAASMFLKAVDVKEKINKYLFYPWYFLYFANALAFLLLAIFGIVELLGK